MKIIKRLNFLKERWFEKKTNKIILITTLIAIIIVILISIFVGINAMMNKIQIKSWDVANENLYTLSEESINKVKDIDKEVNIYFFGHKDSDVTVKFAKKYNEVNEKIHAEAIDINSRHDLAEKYGVDSNESPGIIVESGEKSKVLTITELYTYDSITHEKNDLTEQKLTNAIIKTAVEEESNVYFLEGHEEYGINDYLLTLGVFIKNEVNNVKMLNLSNSEIPEKCDVIIIANPKNDFSDIETNRIIEYINNGGKIVWLGEALLNKEEMPNINKVLEQFGCSLSKGIVIEEDANKMILQNPELIVPDIVYHNITQDLSKLIIASAGKINVENDEKLEDIKVTVNKLITSSEKSFYREDLTVDSASKADNEEYGPYILGAEFIKKINEEKSSTLVIYSNCKFVSDIEIYSTNYKAKLINLYENRKLILNTIGYLTNREDSVKIKKVVNNDVYVQTIIHNLIILLMIVVIPIIIIMIITGCLVLFIRRKK